MSYIGNQSQTAYSSLVKQDITGNGGSTYTLSHPVSSENDILLYINNVKQEGGVGKAFTATGTTLTLSENISSSDSCYVQYIGLAIQTVVPPDGSVSTAKIANSAVDLTSKVTGVLPVANGGTGLASNPLFLARGANDVAMANNTWVKVAFNSKVHDVGGYYDPTTNYRYTPQVSGKYLIYGRVYITYGTDAIDTVRIAIYKNGINVAEMNRYSTASTTDIHGSVQVQSIIDMNGSSDYVEIYARQNISADGVYYANNAYGEFSGYRIGA